MKAKKNNSLTRTFPRAYQAFTAYVHDIDEHFVVLALSWPHAELLLRDLVYERYNLRSCFIVREFTANSNNLIIHE